MNFIKRLDNKIWLLLTNTMPNMYIYRGYYDRLNQSYNEQMKNAKKLIWMDISRTYANIISQHTKDQMLRILYNYSKRNMEMGYCQGLNFICYYFLTNGFSEEETFWILAYIIEEIIPKNYYINMVPLLSDTKILKHILELKFPLFIEHIKDLYIDLNFILIPWFVMVFTNLKHNEVT